MKWIIIISIAIFVLVAFFKLSVNNAKNKFKNSIKAELGTDIHKIINFMIDVTNEINHVQSRLQFMPNGSERLKLTQIITSGQVALRALRELLSEADIQDQKFLSDIDENFRKFESNYNNYNAIWLLKERLKEYIANNFPYQPNTKD